MMGLAPLEPEFKTLQEKNYPQFCFHFRSVWGQYLRGGRFPSFRSFCGPSAPPLTREYLHQKVDLGVGRKEHRKSRSFGSYISA